MASGQVLTKLRNYYSKAESQIGIWNDAQKRVASLLATVGNVMERLPALYDSTNYGALAEIPHYPKKLLRTQLVAVEDLLSQLQAALSEMAAATQALQKLSRDAQHSVQQDRRLTPTARALAAGPVPSVNQCLDGLHQIWRMHDEELRLQRALVAEVHFDTPAAEVKEAARAAAARPNINSQQVKDLCYVVAATAEAPR